MKVLAIETSCDETALSLLEISGDERTFSCMVIKSLVHSQIELHQAYGGVYPNLAKREHAKNLPHILSELLSGYMSLRAEPILGDQEKEKENDIRTLLSREHDLAEGLFEVTRRYERPDIDMICVTSGPGLEPALWVGIHAAIALGKIWNIPVFPVNHMEGHIVSVLIASGGTSIDMSQISFPVLSLLISGGHTEFVKSSSLTTHETIGETRDDAVGEAFDKVARLLGLPYPGGPKISALARASREMNEEPPHTLPRPMIHSKDLHFSFSGLKTAVLYLVRDLKNENKWDEENSPRHVARAFEDAVLEVLAKKTKRALEETGARTLIVAGGVAANDAIRSRLRQVAENYDPSIQFLVPLRELATDNSVMIGVAGYFEYLKKGVSDARIIADGNLGFESKSDKKVL